MHLRVIEDTHSPELVEHFIGSGFVRVPFSPQVNDQLSAETLRADLPSCQILRCREYGEIDFSSRQFCAVIAFGDGDITIRKDLRIVYDGYMPVGALCFMASAKFVSFEPRNSLSLIVLSADQPQIEALGRPADLGCPRLTRKLGDFNVRSNDLLKVSSSLLNAAPGSRHLLVRELFGKALNIGRDTSRPQKLPWWRLRKVKDYVRTNISGKNCLRELADVAGLSRMHFAAQFKAATCLSPHDFVLQERSRAAAAMLCTTKAPIIEIALSVGFQNQAHFSTVFKAVVGATPASFRRRAEQQFADSQRQTF